jgi:peptide/nickel transport system substrate-binding protein
MGKDAFCLKPVGTGPFKIKSVERNVLIKYEKFEGYWQKGKPYLDAIEIHMIKDPMTAVAAFKANKAHLLLSLPVTQVAAHKSDDRYKVMGKKYDAVGLVGDSSNPNHPLRPMHGCCTDITH